MISIEIPIGLFCLLSGVILIMDYGRKTLIRLLGIAGVVVGLTSFLHCCVSSEQVDYQLAKGYFVRNDINVSDIPTRIDNPYAFEKYFGTAAFMGPEGTPTKFDFSKQTIIPIALESTDKATEIKVLGCSEDADVLKVRYKVLIGGKQSFDITPLELVIVKKLDNQTKVELIKE